MPEKTSNHRPKRRSTARLLRRVLSILFVLAVGAMIVYAWMPKPITVEIAPASRGALVVTVDEDGRARVKDRYVVSAPLSGNLARLELNAGDAVERNAILARIVPLAAPLLDSRTRTTAEAQVAAALAATKQAKAQIERAEAAVAYAKRESNRQTELAKQRVGTQAAVDRAALEEKTRSAELASAKFASRVAQYELQMARAALVRMDGGKNDGDQMNVPSPVKGRVLSVVHESEGVVQAGAPLLEVGDPSALEIVVDVLTSDAVKIQTGSKVSIERWGGPKLSAHVRLVEPSAFSRMSALGVEEQRVNVVIDLDEPYEQWSALGDGYRVEAKITTWSAKDVTKIPASALFRDDDGWAVFVVRDGAAALTPVKIGQRNALEVQIESGVEADARVIVHPSDRVTDGVAVKPAG